MLVLYEEEFEDTKGIIRIRKGNIFSDISHVNFERFLAVRSHCFIIDMNELINEI
jgi:hypothetical protein